MARLRTLGKLVQEAKINTVANQFVSDLNYSIAKDNQRNYIPSKSFKPSGISGCLRSLYYELTGVKPDSQSADANLSGICESGSDRHETLQEYIMGMQRNGLDCKWLDVGQYLREQGITDPKVLSRQGNETKLYSNKYNMRFLCDGLIQYRGEVYILEIKTESTYKFDRHQEPWPDHIMQATCYAMNLKVNKVIFLYENRDCCAKKGYLVTVTDKMIQRVANVIDTVNRAVVNGEIPARCEDATKCSYCQYKNQCRREGN